MFFSIVISEQADASSAEKEILPQVADGLQKNWS